MSDYYFSTNVNADIDAAEQAVSQALKERGFGVLTRIDMAATFKAKIDEDIEPYVILGACNPVLAFQAVRAEAHIGTMLPCNVILRSVNESVTEVSAVDPVKSMQAIDNPSLGAVALDVRQRLIDVIESL